MWFTECEQMFFMDYFFLEFMTDMTKKWMSFVIHDQNFGNLTRQTWNFKRYILYMTNFLGFERFDMLTKLVEFSLHMTKILGIWWIWHANGNGWIYATHDEVFRILKVYHANENGWIFATHDEVFRNLIEPAC